jgi:hypothetical protein
MSRKRTIKAKRLEDGELVESCPADLRRFFGNAYDFKRVAHYDIEAGAPISSAEAGHALNEAERFVAAIRALVP